MRGSKKYTYVLPDIFIDKATGPTEPWLRGVYDQLRLRMGNYWVKSSNSLTYGDPEQKAYWDATFSGEITYGPVVTHALSNPPFYNKEQVITFIGDDAVWDEVEGMPSSEAFQDMIYQFATNPMDSDAPVAAHRDLAFRIDTPFSQLERKMFDNYIEK